VGPRLEKVNLYRLVGASRTFFLPPGCSFWLSDALGTEAVGARDDSWRDRFAVWLYLAAKPSHVEGRCGRASLPSTPAYGP
jgi:hypothetical protein